MRFIIIIAALMGAACSLVFSGEVRITAINVESDTAKAVTGVQAQQIFSASQHTTRTDNPHAVTATQLGALTAESDPLSGPRLAMIELNTNSWDAAVSWGNHALAGYLPAALWQSWLATNTYVRAETDQAALAALAAYAATNRMTRWQDASDAAVWWEGNGGTNITAYRLELAGTNFIHHVDNFTAYFLGTFDVSFPTTAVGDGWTFHSYVEDGKCVARTDTDSQTIEYVSASSEFPQTLISTVTDHEAFTQTVSIASYVYTTNVLASYNLTTGNVWQAVAEARQSAEQAAGQIAGHTSDTDPHPGLFAPAEITNAPAWLVYTNIASAVTVTNQSERPVRIYGASATATGTVSFASLREPLPLLFEASNFAAMTFPNAYVIGGGAWQTNMVNLFIAFRSGPDTFITPITAREP